MMLIPSVSTEKLTRTVAMVYQSQKQVLSWNAMMQGVFHVECKYTSRGARLIEVNCRMGGGPVRNINLLVWGVDLVEEHLLTTAGIPSRPPVSSRPLMHIAEFSSNARKTGSILNDDFCKVSKFWDSQSHSFLEASRLSGLLLWLFFGSLKSICKCISLLLL